MCPNNNISNASAAKPVISSSYSAPNGNANANNGEEVTSFAVYKAKPLPHHSQSFSSSSSTKSKSNEKEYSNKNDPNASQLPQWVEQLSSTNQFLVLSGTMFLFFGAHNLLQEAIMKVPGFDYGVMLSYMEVLGVTACSFIERKYVAKETGNVAPLSTYPFLTFCLLSSSALSNMSLNYINFPTKAVFRSSKLIPTMLIATIINRRIFKSIEYVSAFAISIGLIVFAAADWKLAPSFNPIGLALVSTSVIFDAILPNAQERNFRLGASRLEVTLYTNFFTLVTMTFTTLWSGDLINALTLATSDHHLACFMMVYTAISYVAISSFMAIVKKYGGVTAVLLGTARKAMSLILSFIFFPKVFSWFYVLGATLVLGGLMVASLTKHYDRQRKMENELAEKQSCFVVEDGCRSSNSYSSSAASSHKSHYVALRGSGDVGRDVEMATPLLTTSR